MHLAFYLNRISLVVVPATGMLALLEWQTLQETTPVFLDQF